MLRLIRCTVRSAALVFSLAACAWAGNDGQEDLDKATETKLNARTLNDLNEVIRLAESALNKGLDEGNTQFANGLLAATLVQRGSLRGALVLRAPGAEARTADLRKAALADLDRAVQLDEKQSQAWLMIAQLNRLPGGDPDRANKALDQAIKSAADDPDLRAKALLFRATATEDNDKKLADLDEAAKLSPGDATIVRTRGLLRADLGKLEDALADLDKAIELDPQNGPTFEAKALILARLKKYDEALVALDQAAQITPESVVPLIQKARIHLMQSNAQAALHVVEQARALDPKNVAVILLQASIEQDPVKRAEILDDAVRVAPQNTMALRTRGLLRADQGKIEDALADLERAIQLQPKESANYEAKALVLAKEKKFDEALAVADRILDVEDDAPSAYRFRATLLNEAGRHQEAIAELEKLLRSDPKDTSTALQLAMTYALQKQSTKAIPIYSEILAREPDHWMVLRGRGDAYLNIGKQSEAIADYEQAMKLEPKDSGILNNLAWVLATSPDEKLRDGKRAVVLATEACELTEYKAAHILSTLAAAYAETGDMDDAKKWVEKGIQIANDEEKKSLAKELESYQASKPVRELLSEEEAKPDSSTEKGQGDQKLDKSSSEKSGGEKKSDGPRKKKSKKGKQS